MLIVGLALASLTVGVIRAGGAGFSRPGEGGLKPAPPFAQARRGGDPEAAKIKNPNAATPESIAAGQKAYQGFCAGCHGKDAKGGLSISVIEDRGGSPPPDLTDEKWDHGSSDGEIFTVIKKGLAPEYFMAPWDGRINDPDIWNLINYIRSLSKKKSDLGVECGPA